MKKTPKKNYRIGNVLRGHYQFEAKDIDSAWVKGTKIFEAGYPCQGRIGREVYLTEERFSDDVQVRVTTYVKKTRPKSVSAHLTHWVEVAHGCTKQKLLK